MDLDDRRRNVDVDEVMCGDEHTAPPPPPVVVVAPQLNVEEDIAMEQGSNDIGSVERAAVVPAVEGMVLLQELIVTAPEPEIIATKGELAMTVGYLGASTEGLSV